jgi:predicted NAD/FAD-binding protein
MPHRPDTLAVEDVVNSIVQDMLDHGFPTERIDKNRIWQVVTNPTVRDLEQLQAYIRTYRRLN